MTMTNDNTLKDLLHRLRCGEWVYGFAPGVKEMLEDVEKRCHELNLLGPDKVTERDALLRGLLGRLGERYTIHSPFRCDFGTNIRIGENFVANYGLTILDEGEVTIGNRVFIGPNVSIYTVIHALLPEQRNAGVMRAKGVAIEDDVWIGGNVSILPGVTIGRGAVVGAGSVVTSSVPAGTLCYGNPARAVRKITAGDRADIQP